jgi:hypothetical protein
LFAPSFIGILFIPAKYFDVADLAKILKKAKNEGGFKNESKLEPK